MANRSSTQIHPPLRHALSAALLVALVANGTPAAAKRFAVDRQVDAGDAAPGDGSCASAAGSCTLRAAVEEANALAGADTIALAAGTYLLSPGLGEIAISGDLTIDGSDPATTVLDGGGQVSLFRVSAARVRVRGLSIRGGRPEDSRVIDNYGTLIFDTCRIHDNGGDERDSAVIHSVGSLTLIDTVLEGNRGTLICAENAVTIERSVLRDNEATIDCEGCFPPPRILRSEIAENQGGIYGCPVVVDSVIRDNDAFGIACPGSGVVLLRSLVSGNGVAGVNSDGSAYVIESTVRNNGSPRTGSLSGLGVYGNGGIVALGRVIARSAEITDNYGYGIYVETSADLENTTISGNGPTGGVYFGDPGSRLSHVTVFDNTGFGIHLHSEADARATHSILTGNTSLDGTPANCAGNAGALTLEGHNIVADDACGAAPAATDLVGVEARLGPLQNNGGPTRTHAPLPDSPAIDGGAATCVAVDQRGARRPQGERCDIGAVEVQTTCGDGVRDRGEDCDDGNLEDGDCCTTQCRFATPPAGDCDRDGRITISDLIYATGIALHNEYPLDCLAADRNADLRIDIAEIVAAVRNALEGIAASCPPPD